MSRHPHRKHASAGPQRSSQPSLPLGGPLRERATTASMARPVLEPMEHPCAGRVWVANIDQRGQGESAFCTLRAERSQPVSDATDAEVLITRLRRDFRRFTGQKGWVWLSPWADPFAMSARDLAGPALKVGEEAHPGRSVADAKDAGRLGGRRWTCDLVEASPRAAEGRDRLLRSRRRSRPDLGAWGSLNRLTPRVGRGPQGGRGGGGGDHRSAYPHGQ